MVDLVLSRPGRGKRIASAGAAVIALAVLFSHDEASARLPRAVRARLTALARTPSAAGKKRYRVILKGPLVRAPEGHVHISGVKFHHEGLIVFHQTARRPRHQMSRVPWQVVFARKIRYGIRNFYKIKDNQPPHRPPRGFRAKSNQLVRKGRWRLALPAGHRVVDFDVSGNLLLIATSSNQGFRDGELGIPFNTVQVFVVKAPR